MLNLLIAIVMGIGVIFGGGAAAVHASQDAIPGDTLYPVKQVVEEAELALTHDPAKKAELHAEFAQERAAEIQALVAANREEMVPEAVQNMAQHLRAAQQLAMQLAQQGKVDAAGKVLARIDATASMLEKEAQHAPKADKQVIEYAHQVAMQTENAFRQQMQMAEKAEKQERRQERQQEQEQQSGNPQENANAMANGKSQKPSSLPAVQTFKIRGEIQSIDGNNWVIDGENIVVPDSARIHGEAEVGKTAEVHGFIDPQGEKMAVEIEITPYVGDKNAPKVAFKGQVESISDGQWVVSGQTIVITPDTKVKGDVQVGDTVSVKAQVAPDGSLVALAVKEIAPVSQPPSRKVTFSGELEEKEDNDWIIAGREVQVNDRTKINGDVEVGDKVLVVAELQRDGTLVAKAISDISMLITPRPSRTPRPTRTMPPVSTPKHTPYPTHTPRPTYTPHPTWMPTPKHTPHPTHTPYPTHTPRPTYTPHPTCTPHSTHTPHPTPTWMPTPHETPHPTHTPGSGHH